MICTEADVHAGGGLALIGLEAVGDTQSSLPSVLEHAGTARCRWQRSKAWTEATSPVPPLVGQPRKV